MDGNSMECCGLGVCRGMEGGKVGVDGREESMLLPQAVCGLLCEVWDGLSEGELLHLLSCEDEVLAPLLGTDGRPPALARMPPAALQLLLRAQLAPALRETMAAA